MSLCFALPGALPFSFFSSSHLLPWPPSTVLLRVWSLPRSSRITWGLDRNAYSGALPHNLCLDLGPRTLFYKSSRGFLYILIFENHCTVAMILKLLWTLDSSGKLLKLLVLRATLQNNSIRVSRGWDPGISIHRSPNWFQNATKLENHLVATLPLSVSGSHGTLYFYSIHEQESALYH